MLSSDSLWRPLRIPAAAEALARLCLRLWISTRFLHTQPVRTIRPVVMRLLRNLLLRERSHLQQAARVEHCRRRGRRAVPTLLRVELRLALGRALRR